MHSSSPPTPRGSWQPSSRTTRLLQGTVIIVALLPVVFIAWQSANLLQNMPMWDEFETVLAFLVNYRASTSVEESVRAFFATANEHVVLTSRLLMVLMYEVTGKINFEQLAIIGNAFMLGVVFLIGRQEKNRGFGLLCAAVASLLIFHMQHYENLFSSYASIDHFQVVLLTTACLILVLREGTWHLVGGAVLATLAVFTLAHGVAVVVVAGGALLLQRRTRAFFIWSGLGALLITVFFWRLGLFSPTPSSLHPSKMPAVGAWLSYWLTMMGGVPAIGHPRAALVCGILALATIGTLLARGGFRRDPFLVTLALNSILACAFIAYGRVNAEGVSALSSRYMVQSAMIWIALSILLVKSLPRPQLMIAGSSVLVALAIGLNITANQRFGNEAERFVQRLVDAARYYDERGTFEGLRNPIFPRSQKADLIVQTAERTRIFEVEAEDSSEVMFPGNLTLFPIIFHFDKVTVASENVHVRGWMLTKDEISTDLEAHLLLEQENQRYLFRGFPESRPDVATANPGRTDTETCGFYYVIPKESLAPGTYTLKVVYIGPRRLLYNNTPQTITITENTSLPQPRSHDRIVKTSP